MTNSDVCYDSEGNGSDFFDNFVIEEDLLEGLSEYFELKYAPILPVTKYYVRKVRDYFDNSDHGLLLYSLIT